MPTDSSTTPVTKVQSIALISSYVPRQCGIGTFCKNLRDGLRANKPDLNATIIALDDIPGGYRYPPEVRFQVRCNHIGDYRLAADLLNINQIDIAILQHEYGLFGGSAGGHVIELAQNLRMPLVTVLHTVLAEPSREERAVLTEIARLSDRVVVMAHKAHEFLKTVYQCPEEKIVVIPHGIPDQPFVDTALYKDLFGLEGRRMILTFGLLSPGKGLGVAIRALPEIVRQNPDAVYVILGATHPHLYKREGNAYLNSLQRLAGELGVADHVVFHNRFVTLEELCRYIGAADIYVTPYPNQAQIVSGTLAYAMGMGKAVVSTPYWYAEEMLAEGRGVLFPFGDSAKLAEAVNGLLADDLGRNAMRKRAYMEGRSMVWSEVGRAYLGQLDAVLEERAQHPRSVNATPEAESVLKGTPEIDISHLLAMTDDTGMLQHAIYAVPDRFHGYCSDDNARALIAALEYYDILGDDAILKPANTYLAFLYHAYNSETRRFRNFMSYDRQWLVDNEGMDEDVQGRVVWALGTAVSLAPNDSLLAFATRLFATAAEVVPDLTSPRAWALALVGIHAYLEKFSGDAQARRVRAELSERLFELFRKNASEEWPWCEDVVTYDNAKIPHALILSGQWLPHDDMLAQGLRSLEWLIRQQTVEDGRISLIGNQEWLKRSGERSRFDQQPIEAMALVEACYEAYHSTRDPKWRRYARQCFNWFLGANDTRTVLYDAATGGCCDGLLSAGPNLNQGAESTLAWLISLMTIHRLVREATLARAAGATLTGRPLAEVAAPEEEVVHAAA